MNIMWGLVSYLGDYMTVTIQGHNMLLSWMAGDGINYPQYLAVGSDSTSASLYDTSLGSEYESSRFSQTSVSSGTGYLDMEYIIPSNLPTEQPAFLREWGIFDSTNGGSIYLRNTFIEFNKTSSYEIQCIQRINLNLGSMT